MILIDNILALLFHVARKLAICHAKINTVFSDKSDEINCAPSVDTDQPVY